MIKRSLMALTLLLALVACTPGASPTVTIPASLPLPSLDASPDASESPSDSEEPTGSDDEETESPSAS